MDGKIVVVTGASAGIGAAGARKLAALGANVAVVGRSKEKTTKIAKEIGGTPYFADFAKLDDVRRVADQLDYPHIDILANNAGLMSESRVLTPDGMEITFQVNHVAPFLLTHLLTDRLVAAPAARVITTASAAHGWARLDLDDLAFESRKFTTQRAYGSSKLANILFTQELARRLADTNVTASSFHPGPVGSEFFRDSRMYKLVLHSPIGKLALTPEQGAQPLVHLATVADAESVNGKYFSRMKPRKPKGTSPELAARLWRKTEQLLGIGDQANR
ncbi:SDR family NAD(P)-dependent oxidoreductase [Kibdelosporangium philippinense]|uniref:SDR family NAD(P)-dependent oxidoreductase n=1 Tax=Kibdelosporangium philippinense TaxID=211113 RepID=A0ABS8Z0P5_9PSEU|nr:SDR family NAD(P)-dependent oxidoreductase [Kibdelosporangium philippinense]MCE7001536.1 SDR family NAD(P)-dependent oxidoreductase [Kibdelosporangium philippinense]